MGSKDRNATWIKLYRGIMNSSVWDDDKRFKAWIYILLETSYGDRTRYQHGRQVKLKRGECFTSIRGMAKAIGCEPRTVKRILGQFEEDGMINYKIVPGLGAFINPLKYEDYQSGNITDDITDSTTDDTADDITDDITDDYTDSTADDFIDGIAMTPHHKKYKKSNTKKEKKEKNTPAAPSSAPEDEMWAWGGPKPKRWTEDDEWSWRNDQSNPKNPRMTRMEIWTEEWGESDD